MQTNKLETQPDNQLASYLPKAMSVSMSTAGGAIMGGLPGALVGLTTSIADEYLISNQKTENHYLTTTAFWSQIAIAPISFFMGNSSSALSSGLKATAALTTGTAFSYFGEDFLSFEKQTKYVLETLLTINKLFDPEKIISTCELQQIWELAIKDPKEAWIRLKRDAHYIYNNEFICKIAKSNSLLMAKVLAENLFLYFIASYSISPFITPTLSQEFSHLFTSKEALSTKLNSLTNSTQILSKYFQKGLQILTLFLFKQIITSYLSVKQNIVNKTLITSILRKSTELFLTKNQLKDCLNTQTGRQILQDYFNDVWSASEGGLVLFNRITSDAFNALISFSYLSQFSLSPILPYISTLFPLKLVLQKLTQEKSTLLTSQWGKKIKLFNQTAEIAHEIEEISLRDGQAFIRYKYDQMTHEQSQIEKRLNYVTKIVELFKQCTGIVNQMIDTAYYGYALLEGFLKINQLPLLLQSQDHIYQFLISPSQKELESIDVKQSSERVEKLITMLMTPEISTLTKTYDQSNKIIFEDYNLKLDMSPLVNINYLELLPTKRYAITGKSGCGKTSTLIDLKDGVVGDLSSSGKITIGYMPHEVMFINQSIYTPKDSTLLETIYFPNIVDTLTDDETKLLKERILYFFELLDIDAFVNEEDVDVGLSSRLDDLEYKLSGGQKKKVAIIQAILKQPKVLILDESFAGLDPKSLITVQKALLKYLPDTMMLVVDHHAHNNNSLNFYDQEVHFGDNKVDVLDI